MGKVKKPDSTDKDDGQKKISNFFQKSADAKTKAKLFSEHGRSGTKASLITEACIVVDDGDDFKPSCKQSTPRPVSARYDQSRTKLKSIENGVSKENLKKSTIGTNEGKQIPIENGSNKDFLGCIPETQLLFTPPGKSSSSVKVSLGSDCKHSNDSQSADQVLIPDTPEDKTDFARPKRPIVRSFLLSSKQMLTNPIEQAKENRKAKLEQKRLASLAAKKGKNLVSVEFNNSSKSSNSKLLDSNPSKKTVDKDSAINLTASESTSTSSERTDLIRPDESVIVNDGTLDVTPTKIYKDTGSVKRMAKGGLSPAGKRSNDETTNDSHTSVVKNLAFSENVNLDTDNVKEYASTGTDDGKPLDENTTENQICSRMNSEQSVVPETQLPSTVKCDDNINGSAGDGMIKNNIVDNKREGSEIEGTHKTHVSDNSVTRAISKSEADDRNEAGVTDRSKAKLDERAAKREAARLKQAERARQAELERQLVEKEEKRRHSEQLLKYQLTGNAGISGPQQVVSVAKDDALSDILLELSSPAPGQPVPSTSHTLATPPFTRTKPTPKGRATGTQDRTPEAQSCTTGLQGGIGNSSKKTGSNKKKLTNVEATVVDSNNMSFSEWTAEDDDFFAQLGVDTGCNKPRNTKCSANKTQKASDCLNTLVSSNKSIESSMKNSSVVKINSRTKKRSSFHGSSVQNNEAIATDLDDIGQYLTPGCQATERSRTQEAVTIEEFSTQQLTAANVPSIEMINSPVRGLSTCTRESVHAAPVQTVAPCSEYGRHLVTKVHYDRVNHQIELELQCQTDSVNRTCTLRGFWYDTHVSEGDTVHVLAEFSPLGHCDITDKTGLIIVHPDHLISGTTVSTSVFCMRKSILKEKFRGSDMKNVAMLYGSIIHSLFQQMVQKKLCTEEAILKEAKLILKNTNNLLEIYANRVTEEKVLEEIRTYIPPMLTWISQHTTFNKSKKGSSSDVQVTRVCDVEENIWSPRYGIKGKIDLTVEVQIKNERKKLVPLELKTGRTTYSIEHKGQVSLYSMMYGERRVDPEMGLLLYLKEPSMKMIPAEHVHQKGLIQMRNELAHYISRQVQKVDDPDAGVTFHLGRLPPPITNLRACQKCAQLINCSIYHREVERRPADEGGMSGLVRETLSHLSVEHVTYFVQWCLKIDLEKQVDQSKKTFADIWCKTALEREEDGLCLSSMVLSHTPARDAGPEAVIITFHRQPGHSSLQPLSGIGFCGQDSVVVSRESPAWIAVCYGTVQEITPDCVRILTERDCVGRLEGLRNVVWRIDKCDAFNTASILYANISRLMTDDPHSHKLRRLIIDRVKPEFINTLSKGSIEKVKSIFKQLNKPQKTAVLKVLMSRDYVLIKGYPGTGKTSTIVALVKVLNVLGFSVLLTSYTHSAVDNILLKLKKDGLPFLRVGRVSKMHPDIKPYSVDSQLQGFTTTEQLESFYLKQKVVATSCLGMNHQLFTYRQFDVCIVDEGSQVVQPACLGPLFMCDKFVLVGDNKQLPPVIQSKEARHLGMDESLFMRLDGLGATFELNVQYRMNREIMRLSNTLVYDGCLQCGSEAVANQTLKLNMQNVQTEVLGPWMSEVLDCSLEKSVIFLDTNKLGTCHKLAAGGGFTNDTEAEIVTRMVTQLTKAGVDVSDIGVIAPYRAQVFRLRERLLGQGHAGSRVEVNSVDQYQGRDKHVIIISFTMSSDKTSERAGELLKDMRRLNVAVTRARQKLILLGDSCTLTTFSPLQRLLALLHPNQTVSIETL